MKWIKRALQHSEIIFTIKLILIFCIFYFGSLFWIGLTAKGRFYSAFANQYLNFIDYLRFCILKTASCFLVPIGYTTELIGKYKLRLINGRGIDMVYSCIGIGLFSFWTAFCIAFPSSAKEKIKWLIIGTLSIFLLNVLRVSILLVIVNKKSGIRDFQSHHAVYNIISYTLIVILCYLYTKFQSNIASKKDT